MLFNNLANFVAFVLSFFHTSRPRSNRLLLGMRKPSNRCSGRHTLYHAPIRSQEGVITSHGSTVILRPLDAVVWTYGWTTLIPALVVLACCHADSLSIEWNSELLLTYHFQSTRATRWKRRWRNPGIRSSNCPGYRSRIRPLELRFVVKSL